MRGSHRRWPLSKKFLHMYLNLEVICVISILSVSVPFCVIRELIVLYLFVEKYFSLILENYLKPENCVSWFYVHSTWNKICKKVNKWKKKMSNKTDKSVRFYYTDNTHSRFYRHWIICTRRSASSLSMTSFLNLGQTLLIFHDLVNTNHNF